MSSSTKFIPPKNIYGIQLKCGHEIFTPILLRKQYDSDYHYILCPDCVAQGKDPYHRQYMSTAWQGLLKVRKVEDDELQRMSDVFGWNTDYVRRFITDRDILRIQPSVPTNRVRPFPYRVRTV